MMDNVSYVQGPAQVLVIIHHLHVSTASPSKGWESGGAYRTNCIAASTLSLGRAWTERGMGALYIKYTWSIGNCATWCNITSPLSCCSLVAFNLNRKDKKSP